MGFRTSKRARFCCLTPSCAQLAGGPSNWQWFNTMFEAVTERQTPGSMKVSLLYRFPPPLKESFIP